ncbi:MAG: nuclear transport factor 2 family protein [Pseudomonadota bacterium]
MILTKLAPIAALGIFAALTPSPANEPAPENRHEIVAALFDTFNAHDAEGLGQFYTENAQVFSPETCTPKTGRLNIAAGYAQMFDQIPDIHDRLEKVIVDGNDVAVTFTATGTINGQTFAMPIAAFLTFEGNQIATDHVFFDADVTPDCS